MLQDILGRISGWKAAYASKVTDLTVALEDVKTAKAALAPAVAAQQEAESQRDVAKAELADTLKQISDALPEPPVND